MADLSKAIEEIEKNVGDAAWNFFDEKSQLSPIERMYERGRIRGMNVALECLRRKALESQILDCKECGKKVEVTAVTCGDCVEAEEANDE